MSEDIFKNYVHELNDSILLLREKKKLNATLMIIYSGIDIMASLGIPEEQEEVTKHDYISWVNDFMLNKSELSCDAEDLYSARCGILHTGRPESKMTKDKKAKLYCYGYINPVRYNKELSKTHKDAIFINIDHLITAFSKGILSFLKSLLNDIERLRIFDQRLRKILCIYPLPPRQPK